jgi:hypothetical protein
MNSWSPNADSFATAFDRELLWAAAPLPGATVDVTAARRAGIAALRVA